MNIPETDIKKDTIHNMYKFPLGVTVSFKIDNIPNTDINNLISLSNIPAINHFNWGNVFTEKQIIYIIEHLLCCMFNRSDLKTLLFYFEHSLDEDISELLTKIYNRYAI